MLENFIGGLSAYLHGSVILAYIAVYLAGVLISFTPCIYPIIPITAAFIGTHGAGSRFRSLVLSIIYVFGMALTYTVLGAVAALSGRLFGHLQREHDDRECEPLRLDPLLPQDAVDAKRGEENDGCE